LDGAGAAYWPVSASNASSVRGKWNSRPASKSFAQTMVAAPDNPVPRSLGNMLVYYWTFLTNLSNLALILTYLSSITTWRWLSWFRHPVTRAGLSAKLTGVRMYPDTLTRVAFAAYK